MNGFYTIAIDGPSGAGKSSLARRLAGMFQFIYVDTGAIYRTVGLAAYRAGIDRRDEAAVAALLPEIQITMGYNEAGEQRMYLDGEDVSAEIRLPEISICASDVAALPAVRAYLLEMQRKLARENHVIMDGRDIGTVVLPEAARDRLRLGGDAPLRPILADTAGGRQMMGCLTPEHAEILVQGTRRPVRCVVAFSPGLAPDAPALVPAALLHQ